MSTVVVGLCLILLMILLRIPIGIALFLGGVVVIVADEGMDALSAMPLAAYNNFSSFTLLGVPMFILAADFFLVSGVLNAAVRVLLRLTRGRRRLFPPGVVGLAMFFAGIAGSSVAEAAALGRVVYPTMRRIGFSPRSIGGIVAVSANLGILIPPSLILIIYGTITQTSIIDLFSAAIVPGILAGLVLMVLALRVRPDGDPAVVSNPGAAMAVGRRPTASAVGGDRGLIDVQPAAPAAPDPTDTDPAPGDRIADEGSGLSAHTPMYRTALELSALLISPVIVFTGIYGGWGTPTEIAAVLVVYAGLLALTLRGWRGFCEALLGSARIAAPIYMLIIGASIFSYAVTLAGVPTEITSWVLSNDLAPWEYLLVLNLILLVLGHFFDGTSMLLLTAPLLFGPAMALHIDPIQLGIIFVVNIELATISPPMGVNLFAVSSVSGMSYTETVMSVLRYYPISFIMLAVVTYVPWLTSFH